MASAPPGPMRSGMSTRDGEYRLLVHGADRAGIVAAVSGELSAAGANIVSLDQHSTGAEGGQFFQRTVFHLARFAERRATLEAELDRVLADGFGLRWRLVDAALPKRVAIFVSRADHCLLDLLWRQRRGDLAMTVRLVVSNHRDLADDVRAFGVPFVHVPVTAETRREAEKEHLNLLKGEVDMMVLARYMQILSGQFLAEVEVPVINIHHSFLPAFIGANPYQRAKDRGVKLIGATAHFVTEDLDEGPIIEQDVVRVSHRHTAVDLRRIGANVERQVLSRAVAWHCEDRVFRDGNSAVVF